MIGKKLINTGGVEAAFLPSQHFDTVTYTGNGGTQRIGGYINRGAVFNGSSSAINLGSTNQFASSGVSVSMWINPVSVTTNQVLIGNGNGGSFAEGDMFIGIRTDGYIGYEIGQSASIYEARYATTTQLTANTWQHILMTFDSSLGTTIGKIYVNGILQSTSSTYAAGGTFSGDVFIGTLDLQLGKRNISGSELWYNGKIDQVRIFNKALSSSEVTTLYGETAASTSKSVTDIFNDDSGVALYQLDGNANDTGGASGKFGSAAIFNGSSSSIEVSSLNLRNLFDTSGELSISFWHNSTYNDYGRIIEFSKNFNISYFTLATKKIQFNLVQSNGTNVQFQSSTTFSDNVWYNVSVTYDSSNIKVYVNGSLDTTQSYNGTIRNFTDSNYQFHTIGSGKSVSSGIFFNYIGKLDQFRIYSSALSSSDVTNLYNETSVPTANLIAHYKLDGDARDEQQQYDGTATNVIYAYDGTATNVIYQKATDFQPDLVWIKGRSGGSPLHNWLTDSVRGEHAVISSNLTNAEETNTSYHVDSFDNNGFTVIGNSVGTNGSNVNYVAWCWKAGNSTVSNTDGTITSQVSANPDAGFSIIKTAGGNSVAGTVGHGLNYSPEMVITKGIDNSAYWWIYHSHLNGGVNPEQYGVRFSLQGDSAQYDASSGNLWNNTAPTNSVISLGSSVVANPIIYAFHSVEGYSKIGSYTGNGSASGPIVETGFEPAFIMGKRTDVADNWWILDNERNITNPRNSGLFPNLSESELTGGYSVDFLSNGFQLSTTNAALNASGGNYIYLAIAADPDVTQPVVQNSFDVVTYTGTNSTQSIDTGFKPDLIWFKDRGGVYSHALYNSVIGRDTFLRSNSTDAHAATTPTNSDLVSFDSNGFTLGTDYHTVNNASGRNYVAWVWKANDHDDNLPQINTNGTIDSIVSVNAAAGFSIVSYTGNNGASATIGHGLSSAPELVIIKARNLSAGWPTLAAPNGTIAFTNRLNSTGATDSSLGSVFFNSTAPTSTVFSVGNSDEVNDGYNYIAYCFHSVDGYQKVGSYTGNGNASFGTSAVAQSITTGFRPRFVLIKITSAADHWIIFDSVRKNTSTTYSQYQTLYPNLANAEGNASSGGGYWHMVDFTDTGFDLGQDPSLLVNKSGATYIYLAIK